MQIIASRFYSTLRNAVVFATLALAASLWSQPAPVQPYVAPKTPLPEEKPLSMSPFEIRSEADVGYQAGNTTSGSRFNSSLKDTPASISPFTPEFLSDIAATTVNEMMAYATNAELNAGDSEGAGFSNPRDFNSAGGEPIRVRGIPADVSTDYVENAAPQDLYNIERAEVASGPNSILFGSGNAGGLVALTTKKAALARSKYSGQAQLGSWAFHRYTGDFNQVIVPKVFALRLNAMDADANSWRRYEFTRSRRIAPALTYRPFAATTLAAAYEDGSADKSVGLRLNASDQITRWSAAGRTVTDGLADLAKGTVSLGANQRFTYYTQDGLVSNLRNELRTSSSPQPADTLLPFALFPYDINWAGPSAHLKREFSNYQFSLEQRFLGDALTVQGIYLHNTTFAQARSFVFNGNTMDLLGDPNLTIPGTTGTGTMANARAGQLYLESNQAGDFTSTENAVRRLTVAYELKLGPRFGNHRLAALGENSEQNLHNASQREILVDQLNRPLANTALPENAQNLLWRRTYVREGDFSTYALTGLYTPLAPFAYNSLTATSRLINSGELYSIKDTHTLMFAAQSSFWSNHLATTFGYREDRIDYNGTTSGRISDPNDPRITSGRALLNEVAALPGYSINRVKAHTLTAGAVVHLTNRFSVFYNQSTNIGAPRFDRRILPDGRIPGTPEGKGRDLGVMIDLLGDNRYFARITYFETSQVGDAAVSPSGAVTNATSLGRQQTLNILQALLAAGKITQVQYDAQSFNWNAAIIDTASSGVEVEFVANPTRNWTIRANYSHSLRDRENFFAEGKTFFAQKAPEWRSLAGGDPTLQNTVETNVASINQEISDRASAQEQGFGSIPHKATVTTRYKFGEGRLAGLFIGGAGRYQSKAFAQTDTRASAAGGTGKDYYANQTIFADAFAGYRLRLPWRNLPVTLQLNVRNLFNSYLATTARYNSDFSGARRVYLRDPRSWRLTASVEF